MNFLWIRLLCVEASVVPADPAFVFLLSSVSEPVVLEVIAATIKIQVFDHFRGSSSRLSFSFSGKLDEATARNN